MDYYIKKKFVQSMIRFCVQELSCGEHILLRADILFGVDRKSTYQIQINEEVDYSCAEYSSLFMPFQDKFVQTSDVDSTIDDSALDLLPIDGSTGLYGTLTKETVATDSLGQDKPLDSLGQSVANSLVADSTEISDADIESEITVLPTDPNHNGNSIGTANEQISCPLCQSIFPDQHSVEYHLKQVHDIGNMYICVICQDIWPSNDALYQHMKEQHESKNHSLCTIDPFTAGRKKMRKSIPMKVLKLKPTQTRPFTARTTRSMTKSAQKGVKTSRVAVKHMPGVTRTPVTYGAGKQALSVGKDTTMVGGSRGVTCDECSKEYRSKRALRRHVMNVHQLMRYTCEMCSKSFTGKESLYHHKRGMHSLDKPYKCEQCNASFNFNHSYKLHLLKHSGQRPYTCSECGKTYLTANHLKIHVEAVHGNKKNYSCHFCGKLFSYMTSLKMHVMSHTGEKPYQCDQCQDRFINSHSLKYHKESQHSTGQRFECDVCGKNYKTAFLMKSHRRRHTAAGSRFMCDICGRQFMFRSTLDAHSVVHQEKKNFHCSVCGKSFKTYATLYSHMYVHKTDSPFQCVECGKSFKTKERCKAHERRHTGLKPFECEICNRCFPDKGGLTKHQKTVHCTVKKFVCEVCGKACSRADNLRVHMKIHSKLNLLPSQSESKDTVRVPEVSSAAIEFSAVFPERTLKPNKNPQNNDHLTNPQPNVMLTEIGQIPSSNTIATAVVHSVLQSLPINETHDFINRMRHQHFPTVRTMPSSNETGIYNPDHLTDHLPDPHQSVPSNQSLVVPPVNLNPVNLTQSGTVVLGQPQMDRAQNIPIEAPSIPTGAPGQMYLWPYMYAQNTGEQDANTFF